MNIFKKIKDKITTTTTETTNKFREGLSRTRNQFSEKLNNLVAQYRTVDEDFFEELEELFIQADIGMETVMVLIDQLKTEVKRRNVTDTRDVQAIILEKLVEIYESSDDGEQTNEIQFQAEGPTVILFVGVNGVGKTTTIGKLAHRFKSEGKTVLLAAGDTFRAGAIEQLEVWGSRVGVEVVKQSEGSDPAAVIFDAVQAAKSRNVDVLICDTAGRLQNKGNLMQELEKINKVIGREIPGAPHEVLLVLDATTGQNALIQTKMFGEVTSLSGIVLSKLDGTAKGGIVIAIRKEMGIPVKYVGLGEKIDDLQKFETEQFVYGLFSDLIDKEAEGQ